MKFVRVILFLAVLGVLLGPDFIRPAAAQTSAGPVSLRITPAFDGYFKNGEWLAVWAEIENSGKNIDGQLSVQITNSTAVTTYAVSVPLPSGARKRVPLYILPNNYSRELEIQLTSPDGLLASQKITVRPQVSLVFMTGLVARERGGLALLNGVTLPGQERSKVLVDVTPEELPERMEGLRSFDLLVFNDVDTSRLTAGQTTALADWVQQGGRLVIGGGSGAAVTLAGLPAGLLPGTLSGEVELQAKDLNGLADFAGGSSILTSGSFIGSKIAPALSSLVLAGDRQLPLAVESRYGEGQVDFIPLNLSTAPFNSWPDTIQFWNKLLAPTGGYAQNLPADISLRQFNNMEMASNLANIPALDLPSIQWLSLLLAVYILLVGPVNYFVLRRLRRLQLAWFTIPALTLLFSAGAFGMGTLLHGTDVILNQIALISPNGSGSAMVTNYLGLFSPSQRSYSLDVQTSGLLSTLVTDNSSFWGAAQPQSGSANMTFIQGDRPQVRGVSIDQWSFQSFAEEERWSQFGTLRADLHLENEKIVGTVRNETPVPLTDIVLVVGSNFIRLGDLAVGMEKPVEMNFSGQVLNRNGMPVSYQIYENLPNMNSSESRKLDLKRTLASRMLDGTASKFSAIRGVVVPGRSVLQGNSDLSATLIAWTDQVPPDVRVEGSQVKKQVMGLVAEKVSFQMGNMNTITIPVGMVPGNITQSPSNGGVCGGSGQIGVMLNNSSAEFSYQLPDLSDYQVKELRLNLSQDGPMINKPEIAFYDFSQKAWAVIKDSAFGLNSIGQPASYIDGNGLVRVRMAGNSGSSGYCTYFDLGFTAEKADPNGGSNVSR